MKIKLLEQQDGRAVFDLDNGYNVIEEACSWNARGFKLTIRPYGNYLPEIYDCTANNATDLRLKIQTKSYGSLDPEVIDVVIHGYKQAIKTVAFLENEYRDAIENARG